MTDEELRKERERLIKADIKFLENRVRHAFNQGYEFGYKLHGKNFVENGEKAYQQGLEDGKRQGVAIDGDKRYWDGYHAAQEDGQKIYQKGLDDAWSAARKIILGNDHSLDCSELYVIFKIDSPSRILANFSASEAVEKIREYEEKQKDKIDIKVGTRVRTTKDKDGNGVDVFQIGTVGTVTEIMQSIPQYKVSANGTYWWYSAEMFEVIEDEKQKRDSEECGDSPCDLCRFSPPGSGDGKPCTMCPAEGKVEL